MQGREGEEEEDNEGVCGPRCSCRRRRGAGLTDKTEEGKDSAGSKIKDGDGTSNRGLGHGCRETHSCLARMRWGRRESRKDGWHKKGEHQSPRSCSSHADVYTTHSFAVCALPISVYILMSTSLSVWICIDETVILFPCRPCVQLSTAPTKTH